MVPGCSDTFQYFSPVLSEAFFLFPPFLAFSLLLFFLFSFSRWLVGGDG